MVLFCQGSSARLAPSLKQAPVDAVVIGIVDTVDVQGKQIFNAQS
jgi:microcompartment protein CcmK/EutM